ncbi:hypothetical protein [uncultured Thiodictyon sp.]|uniref:hypothetical protein n=1 Tax=uncultured Thiodictyon sp. TaxID=1846217 RepID=UPI0025F5A7E2|nr:hypothetical protein [uncultured Thiodictyon sp.]
MPPDTWELTDHVCRRCFGRVLSRRLASGCLHARCANCGAQVTGEPIEALCCCGLLTTQGRDAQFRCARNPAPTPEHSSELMVCFLGAAAPRS